MKIEMVAPSGWDRYAEAGLPISVLHSYVVLAQVRLFVERKNHLVWFPAFVHLLFCKNEMLIRMRLLDTWCGTHVQAHIRDE